jgi:hypothetical protein
MAGVFQFHRRWWWRLSTWLPRFSAGLGTPLFLTIAQGIPVIIFNRAVGEASKDVTWDPLVGGTGWRARVRLGAA